MTECTTEGPFITFVKLDEEVSPVSELVPPGSKSETATSYVGLKTSLLESKSDALRTILNFVAILSSQRASGRENSSVALFLLVSNTSAVATGTELSTSKGHSSNWVWQLLAMFCVTCIVDLVL